MGAEEVILARGRSEVKRSNTMQREACLPQEELACQPQAAPRRGVVNKSVVDDYTRWPPEEHNPKLET